MLDPTHAPTRVVAAWECVELFDVECSIVDGKAWLTVPGVSAGLPIERLSKRPDDRSNWRDLLNADIIDIERLENGTWRPFDYLAKDWGEVIKNAKA